ncbi:hypothetical protein RJ641_029415 [Dillenia turbinata]|uniref:TLC domain-containing protein n=1 Tax=Dillenia turbinata TaxID=194707 RepID=A0AAN8ZG87_9MAGN
MDEKWTTQGHSLRPHWFSGSSQSFLRLCSTRRAYKCACWVLLLPNCQLRHSLLGFSRPFIRQHLCLSFSFLHYLCLRATSMTRMFEHSQLFGSTWPWAYQALCFSCGYLAYGQWDMLQYRLYSGWIPSILLHHMIPLICFTLALYQNVTINYLIHLMAGFRDGKAKIVRIEWFLNWVTFTVARFACHVLITAKLIKDASKFEKGVELPLALFGMAGMNLLNVCLVIDLFGTCKRGRNTQLQHHERTE